MADRRAATHIERVRWNYRFGKERAASRALLHAWNAFLCSLLGLFLLAIGPTILSMNPDHPYVVIGGILFVPFFVASLRSGRKSLTWWRHPLHALLGLGLAYSVTHLPAFDGPNDVGWAALDGFACLVLVSWLSDSWRAERNRTAVAESSP